MPWDGMGWDVDRLIINNTERREKRRDHDLPSPAAFYGRKNTFVFTATIYSMLVYQLAIAAR